MHKMQAPSYAIHIQQHDYSVYKYWSATRGTAKIYTVSPQSQTWTSWHDERVVIVYAMLHCAVRIRRKLDAK